MLEVTARLLLLVTAGFLATAALKLPEYIKPCSRKDPKINECATKHAQAAIADFVKGDRKYKIPLLDPLLIPILQVHEDTNVRAIGLGFVATNCSIRGLKDMIIDEVRSDVEKDHYEYYIKIPKLQVTGNYNVSGRVLILPIAGTGKVKLEFDGVKLAYKYDIVLKERNGANYSDIRNAVFEFDVLKRMTIQLDNLFNGDETLGKQMNLFLNENWKDVLADIGPAIADAIGQITTTILGNIFNTVPYDDAWLP